MFLQRLQAAQAEVHKEQETHKESQKQLAKEIHAGELSLTLTRTNTNIVVRGPFHLHLNISTDQS